MLEKDQYSEKDIPLIIELIKNTDIFQMISQFEVQEKHIKIVEQMFQLLKQNRLLQTKWLGLFSQIFTLQQFTCFDGIFLSQCIQSQNYKLGYQHVKRSQWGLAQTGRLANLELYFLCAGIIMQAMQDYDEALRYYNIAIKLSNRGNQLKEEAIKLKTLLMFRMGIQKSLAETARDNSQIMDEYLSQLVVKSNQSDQQTQTSKQFQQDKDVKLCLQECQEVAPILYELQKKKKIFHRISFKQICEDCKVNEGQLISLLLEVNQMCDMLLINEEKQYIQFKRNHSLAEINEKLDERLDLVRNLLSIR